MKNLIVLLFTLFSSFEIAYANDDYLLLGNNPGQTVSQWHAMGEQVYLSNTNEMYYEGRCFFLAKNSPGVTAALVLTSKENERNAGPAFPNDTEYKVFLLEVRSTSEMTPKDLKESAYRDWYSNLTSIGLYEPLKWTHESKTSGDVHKFNGYFTAQTQTTETKDCKELRSEVQPLCKNGKLLKGTALYSCYFFRKIESK